MNRKTFLKTAIGSAAALAAPNILRTKLEQPRAIPSEFAFGGEFKFREITFYKHPSKAGISSFFRSIFKKHASDKNLSCYLINREDRYYAASGNFRTMRDIPNDLTNGLKQIQWPSLVMIDEFESFNEFLCIKNALMGNPNLSILISKRQNGWSGPWPCDKIINFTRRDEEEKGTLFGPWTHRCELVAQRKKIEFGDERCQFFRKGTGKEFEILGTLRPLT